MKMAVYLNDVLLKSHFYAIQVFEKQGGKRLQLIRWDNLPWDVRNKWNWYFEYRAALAKVQHPRCYVKTSWGHVDAEGEVLEKGLKNRIIAKKRKITEVANNLEKARSYWFKLFPIEDDRLYKKCVTKHERLKTELTELENLYKLNFPNN